MGAKGGKRSKGGKRKKGPSKSAPPAVAQATELSDHALSQSEPQSEPQPESALEPDSKVETGPDELQALPPVDAPTLEPTPTPEFVGDGLKDESAIDSPYATPIPATTEQPHYAGLIRRTAALAFDTLFLALLDIGVLAYLFGRLAWDFIQPLNSAHPDPLTDPERVQQTFIALCVLLLVNWLYFVACECSPLRRTFGMAVFNARLKTVLPDGTLAPKVSFFGANLRFFGRLLTALTLGIGFVVSLASKRRQALHDRISKTVVVVE